MAPGNPFSPSTQALKTFCTLRLRSSVTSGIGRSGSEQATCPTRRGWVAPRVLRWAIRRNRNPRKLACRRLAALAVAGGSGLVGERLVLANPVFGLLVDFLSLARRPTGSSSAACFFVFIVSPDDTAVSCQTSVYTIRKIQYRPGAIKGPTAFTIQNTMLRHTRITSARCHTAPERSWSRP